jgi:hypothetical protein
MTEPCQAVLSVPPNEHPYDLYILTGDLTSYEGMDPVAECEVEMPPTVRDFDMLDEVLRRLGYIQISPWENEVEWLVTKVVRFRTDGI